jgi:probable phosphoglycerate mutase
MHRLLLVRHGESAWNALGRWQGWADIPLSEAGEAEAKAAAQRLVASEHRFDALASSDLLRARHTAEILAACEPAAPLAVEPRLRERDVGDWSGLTSEEVEQRWPGYIDRWRTNELLQCPGGEHHHEFLDRILSGLRALRTHLPDGGTMLVVTHGGVIRTIEAHLGLGASRVHNLGGRWFHLEGDALTAGESAQL